MPGLADGEGLSILSLQPREIVTTLVVSAAIIERDGRFLITRRLKGVHLEGLWAFPGGKCEGGESLEACLARELKEELDVAVLVGGEIFTTTHIYPDGAVELHFLKCELLGEPAPRMGQQMSWAARDEITTLAFPPADAKLIRMLTRRHYRVLPNIHHMEPEN